MFVGDLGELSPYEARDAAGFVELMQQLKELSGLTYRELEERAARSGDVLARSTLADILRRTTPPRPDVLAAFVRACGDGPRVGSWLDARDRIVADISAVSAEAPGSEAGAEVSPAGESAGARPRRTRGRTVVLACGLVTPLFALAVWGLVRDDSDDAGAPAAAATAAWAPADGWVTIRPAHTPDLCLTDGRDRAGAYTSAVAVQLPCARATVPRTYLEPVGEGLYRIQWHHPVEGKGCLTVLSTGPVKGMLEPRNNCAQGTLFRVETSAADSAGGFLLRPAGSDTCIGIAGDDTVVGAEAIEERCTGAADQRFLIGAG
ncbi:XRE family transcriptional regulator [Streptomyces sp. NBC_01190]|uniref:XRE family transcriptional regulator n=1 Tax=Streptomyces sp. NBC_01190 TaxID=2903767 RepID=UPI00386DE59E|nr:helix-turn-helix transcriptional regulator [Streptomyces sp. NBC_01190]